MSDEVRKVPLVKTYNKNMEKVGKGLSRKVKSGSGRQYGIKTIAIQLDMIILQETTVVERIIRREAE